jgi:omega-6 fatty acid desaturase (delta-12 desaturase)
MNTSPTKQYMQPSTWRSLWQLSSTVVCYIGLWFLAYKSLAISYWLTFAITIVASFFAIRTFIIHHDCSHGSFFKSKRWNKVVGRITGFLSLTPFYFWQYKHNTHHRVSGNLDYRNTGGDIWMMTAQEYINASFIKKLTYKLFRNPIILFFIIAPFYFIIFQRFPFIENKNEIDSTKAKLCNSVYLTNIAMVAAIIGLSLWIGPLAFIKIELPIVVMASALGVWLFYVQHQFEDTQFEKNASWDFTKMAIEGSSFYKLPKLFQWLTANIGYHHVHHANPRIPNYFLPKCHEATPDFKTVKPLTFINSIKTVHLKLWDEVQGKLIRFKDLKKRVDTTI